jgi:hypothetical protein
MSEMKSERELQSFYKKWKTDCLRLMTVVDEYPNGRLYHYCNQRSDIPALWTFSGQNLLIIAEHKKGETQETIFKKIVGWLCCMKKEDFNSIQKSGRPCYAAKIDPITKDPKIAYYESGSWTNMMNLDEVETQFAASSMRQEDETRI